MKAICIKEPGKVEIVEQEMPVRKPGEALLTSRRKASCRFA